MESLSTLKQLFAGNKIVIYPNHAQAFFWESKTNNGKFDNQIIFFLNNLNYHAKHSTKANYYFGHFIFEKKSDNEFAVIDGQQRLTAIIILVCCIYNKLKKLRELTDDEIETYEDIVRRGNTYRFSTIEKDNQLFKEYVINGTKQSLHSITTKSSQNIVSAFNYFTKWLKNKSENDVVTILKVIENADCTTYTTTSKEANSVYNFHNIGMTFSGFRERYFIG